MEKQLLKKSGIIAVIITFSALAFWFGFAKLSLGAYNEKNLTYQFLKEDSEVFKTLVIEVGTDTVARIIAGTSSMTRTGTATYPGQPRIEYSGVTGKWSFKNSGGTETVAFGTVSAAYVAAEIGSATANYVLKTNGSSTGQLATDTTLAGSTTIGTGSTITAGTSTFSGTKVGYLADVTSPIGASIDTKLARVGTSATYINSATADGKTGTTSVSIAAGSPNLSVTSTLSAAGALAVFLDTTGSATAKPDIKEGGTVTVTNAAHINFDNTHFNTAVDGSGASITLSDTRAGTTSVLNGYVPISNANNLNNWVKPNLSFVSKTDTQTIATGGLWVAITGLSANLTLGSTTSKVRVSLTVTGVSSPNSWVRLLRDGTAIAVGDSASSRIPCTLGDFFSGDGNAIFSKSTVWVDSPGSTTVSYTVEVRTSSASNFYVNRSQTDTDSSGFPRGQSSLYIEELYQ